MTEIFSKFLLLVYFIIMNGITMKNAKILYQEFYKKWSSEDKTLTDLQERRAYLKGDNEYHRIFVNNSSIVIGGMGILNAFVISLGHLFPSTCVGVMQEYIFIIIIAFGVALIFMIVRIARHVQKNNIELSAIEDIIEKKNKE